MAIYLGIVDEVKPQDNYDKYLWLGRCCQKGILWCDNHEKKYQIFENEWKDTQNVQRAEQYLKKIKNNLLCYATTELNRIHGTAYEAKSWNVLLSCWINLYLTLFYDKYLKLKKVMQSKEIYEVVLYETTTSKATLDCLDYLNQSEEDEFHRYQYSLLIDQMPELQKQLKIIRKEYEGSVPNIGNYLKPEYVKDFEEAYRSYKNKNKIEDDVVIQNPYIKFTLYKEIMDMAPGKISGYLKNYFGEIRKHMSLIVNNEYRSREKIEEKYIDDEFERIMYKLFMRSLPVAYVEDFKYLKSISEENYKYAMNPNAVIFESGGILYDEMFKIYMMGIVDTEAVKISVQHGLGNGIWRDIHYETEYELCDVFWTSGWEVNKKNPYFVKMPFVKYFRLNEIEKKNNEDKILYVSYAGLKYPTRLIYADLKSDEYMSNEIDFLNSLNSEVRDKMKVRLYDVYKSFGWLYGEIIKEKVKNVKFDIELNFYSSLSETSMVVTELFSTTFMETLFMNIPVISVYGPEYLAIREEKCLEKEIQALVDVGVIAGTPREAIKTINKIHNCVEDWWNEPKRQKAVNEFKKKYCYFPENSEKIWKDKIYEYVR